MSDELQVENGNYTRIVNPLIEHLIQVPFKGCELAVAIYIIRKTYGFNKTQDSISLSQFCKDVKRARSTINLALKTLQVVGIVKLVRRGDLKGASNIWKINKYFDTWELVRLPKLVRQKRKPSMTKRPNLVRTVIHTKDNNKRQTKDSASQGDADIPVIINLFKEVNPSYQRLFGMPPQRAAAERLKKTHGMEKLSSMIAFLPKSNTSRYAPTITTPVQFEQKLGDLIAWGQKQKDIKKTNVAFV